MTLSEHIEEYRIMLDAKDKLDAEILLEGDGVVDGDPFGDVYRSDMLHVVEQQIDDRERLLRENFNYDIKQH